jgi:parallel beta-helix repeat protein
MIGLLESKNYLKSLTNETQSRVTFCPYTFASELVEKLEKLSNFSEKLKLEQNIQVIESIFEEVENKFLINPSGFSELETSSEKLLIQEQEFIFLQDLVDRTSDFSIEVLRALSQSTASLTSQKAEIEASYETAAANLISQQAKARAKQQIDTVMEAQNLLVEISRKLDRVKTLIDTQLRAFEDMNAQTQQILNDTRYLSERLVQVQSGYDLLEEISEMLWIEKEIKSEPLSKLILTVSQDGTGQYKTISQAIDNASEGSQIRVMPGIYREGLIINKPLEIVGEVAMGEIAIEYADASCISIQSDRVKISGLTIRGRANYGAKFYHAVDISSGQAILESCDISSDALACVAIHGRAANPIIRRCKIHRGKQGGILVYQGGKGLVEECEIFDHPYLGIAIRTYGNPTIRRCQIYRCQQGGIYVWERGFGAIEDCEIYDNFGPGIRVSPDSNTTLRQCRVR